MKILLYFTLLFSGMALCGHASDINDYYAMACGIIVSCSSLAAIFHSYKHFMENNEKILNPTQYHKYTATYNSQASTPYYNTNVAQTNDYYYPSVFNRHQTAIQEISNKLPLTTSIVSYTPTERVSKENTQPQTSQYVNESFLKKIDDKFINPMIIDYKPFSIDNDIENKLSVPSSELTTTYTYTSTSKVETNVLKIPFEERFTPYKAKIYNDIIQIISHQAKSFILANKVLNAIPYIECTQQKIILYIRQSTIQSTFDFPFQEITQRLQERLGTTISVDFAPISSLSIAEYFIKNLYQEPQCQPSQNNTNTNAVTVGTKS